MPKYLVRASYTAEGLQGLLQEGGSNRRAAVSQLVSELGGSLEAFYYAFGDADVYGIADLPDDESAAALALTVSATGTVAVETVALLTPEQIDEATKKTVGFRPAGAP